MKVKGTAAGLLVVLAALVAAPSPLASPERRARAAASQPSVVLWFGGRAPGTPVSGVLVKSNGSAQVLAPGNRAAGTTKVVKSFTPSAAQLAAIRSAANKAFTGPAAAARAMEDGFFATAVIEKGTQRRALVGANALPARLNELLGAMRAAVPAQATAARRALGYVRARAAADPATAPCPPGKSATRYGREASLKDAARLGLVKLTSKGGFDKDGMAIDANYKDVPLPTVVRLDIEVVSDIQGVDTALETKVEQALAGQKISSGPLKGQPVRFDLNVHRRLSSDPPRPCWHQLAVSEDRGLRDHVSGLGPGPESGEIGIFDRSAWTHEVLHLAGLADRYNDVFKVGKNTIPLPQRGLEGEALAAELAKHGVKPENGLLSSRPQPGFGGNIMADTSGKLFQRDLKRVAQLAQDQIIIHSNPGDVLASKNGSLQNLVNGGPVDLTLKRGGRPVHVDGMVVYCIDLHHHSPAQGTVYDVLGPAAEQPDPGMQALARLIVVAARHQPAELAPAPSAQDAIWRITDDAPPFDSSKPLLAEAGIPDNTDAVKYNAPHFNDPNAASPTTGAVTPTAVLPPLDLGPPPPRLPPLRPRLAGAVFLPAVQHRARVVLAVMRVKLVGADDTIALTLQRRAGRRFRRVRGLGRRRLQDGTSTILLGLRRLPPGSYRVAVRGSRGPTRFAALNVQR